MITDFQSIVDEWSYRVGIIDSKNYKHLYHLNQILYEHGWTQDVIEELSKKLTEDDIVRKKQPDGSYEYKSNKGITAIVKPSESDRCLEPIPNIADTSGAIDTGLEDMEES